jgi:hypothetical protein
LFSELEERDMVYTSVELLQTLKTQGKHFHVYPQGNSGSMSMTQSRETFSSNKEDCWSDHCPKG